MLGSDSGVLVERQGSALRVTLASPDNRNAQSPAMWRRLAAIEELVDADTRAVVVDAEGKSFSAGLDRRMLTPEGIPGEPSILSGPPEDIEDVIAGIQSAFTWWRRTPAITIALVHGHAIGAGFQLALACDLMVVADDALLAMRETSLGLVPDLAGTAPLVERVGYSRALEICATGRYVAADEAVQLGIAVAQVPRSEWTAWLDGFLTPVTAALPGAVSELKWLLQGAAHASDQPARERAAQARRLAELRSLLGG